MKRYYIVQFFLIFVLSFIHCGAVSAHRLYWTDRGTDKIQRSNLDGTAIEDLISTGLLNPRGLSIDQTNSKMYWTDGGTDKIQRSNLDGTAIEDLITTGLIGTRQLTLNLSEGKIYWADIGQNRWYRSNLSGTDVEEVSSFGIQPYGVAVHESNKLIYMSQNEGGAPFDRLLVGDLNNSLPFGSVSSFAIDGPVRSIALDEIAGKIYMTTDGEITRINTDGTGLESIVVGLGDPEGITLFGGKVYWTDPTTGLIQRADLTGTNVETVISGLVRPSAIAIESDALPIAAIPALSFCGLIIFISGLLAMAGFKIRQS